MDRAAGHTVSTQSVGSSGSHGRTRFPERFCFCFFFFWKECWRRQWCACAQFSRISPDDFPLHRLSPFLSSAHLICSSEKKKTVSGGRTGGGSASVLLLRDTDSPPSRARPASRAGGAVRTGCCSPSPTPYRTSILPCAAGRRASRFESKYRIEGIPSSFVALLSLPLPCAGVGKIGSRFGLD